MNVSVAWRGQRSSSNPRGWMPVIVTAARAQILVERTHVQRPGFVAHLAPVAYRPQHPAVRAASRTIAVYYSHAIRGSKDVYNEQMKPPFSVNVLP